MAPIWLPKNWSSTAPASTTSRTSPSGCRGTASSASPGCPAPASRRSPSTRSTRGPAPLRRVALGLRAAVPPDDGEAGRRPHRRPQPGDLDRPEDDLAQPALDGRHRDRDLRLPAPALRAGRAAALPDLRQADRGAEPRRDRRPGAEARGGHAVHGQRAGRPRPQGRVQGGLRGSDARGLHARQGRRRAVRPRRGRARARQEVQARRSRWSSTGS